MDALRWLVRNPHVRVVHNLPNPLVVLVSRYKHKNKGVVAQCTVGDAACLESHRNARPMLPTKGGGLVRLIGEVAEESDHTGREVRGLVLCTGHCRRVVEGVLIPGGGTVRRQPDKLGPLLVHGAPGN